MKLKDMSRFQMVNYFKGCIKWLDDGYTLEGVIRNLKEELE